MDYWFEHELRQYRRTRFDWDAIKRDAARLTLAVGDDTQGLPPYDMAHRVAARAGAPVKVLPGGHVGYASFPEAFARELTALLA